MSEEERAEMYSEFESQLQEELGEDAKLIMGGPEQSQEEWENLMPEQSRSFPKQILTRAVMLLIFVGVFSPAILFVLVGFQAGVIAFLVMFLLFFVQFV